MIRLMIEAQGILSLSGACLGAAMALMTDCGMVAPSDSRLQRGIRKASIGIIALAMMWLFTYSSWEPSYLPSWPGLLLLVGADMLMIVSISSAMALSSRKTQPERDRAPQQFSR